MCLILFAWHAHPRYRLIFAANRDEYFRRPAAAAAQWTDLPGVLGGRDLDKGGSWLAIDRLGRWAAVTNIRARPSRPLGDRSRGFLVRDYFVRDQPACAYAGTVQREAAAFPGFNLLVGDAQSLLYVSSHRAEPTPVAAGIHGLSNGQLDTPWPKVRRGIARLEALSKAPEDALTAGLFELLLDRTRAADAELPDTGVGLEWERTLSAPFIVADGYGTRASTVLLVDSEGNGRFEERSFGPCGVAQGRRQFLIGAGAQATD